MAPLSRARSVMTCSKLVDDLDRNWSALTHDASGESYACCAADLSLGRIADRAYDLQVKVSDVLSAPIAV
jgi:hypothetical protein